MSEDQTYPLLSKPPIKTAIIEIRYSWIGKQEDSSYFANLGKHIKEVLPTTLKGDHKDITFKELSNGKIEAKIEKTFVRDYRFTSEDKKSILLVSKERFNYNINNNYSSWSEFIKIFSFLWGQFALNVAKSDDYIIDGVSIRYINNIDLPDSDDLSKYFNTTIYAEKQAIPHSVSSYMINYRSSTEDNVELIITQGLEPNEQKFSYLFDIDVIKNSGVNSENLWLVLERLRDIKNLTFFSNLTPATLSILQ